MAHRIEAPREIPVHCEEVYNRIKNRRPRRPVRVRKMRMSPLFGGDFQKRVELQRRQTSHQELLDSRRFRARAGADAPVAEQHSLGGGEGVGGCLVTIGGFLALILLLYAIPAGIVSAVAAFPVALAVLLVTRASSGHWTRGHRAVYRAALLGIFVYLTLTVITVFSSPFLFERSSIMLEVSRRAAHALMSVEHGKFSFEQLLGVPAKAESFSRLCPALILVHGPGLLACAGVLSRKVGAPLYGVKGFVKAATLSLLLVPASLGAAFWAVSELFRVV